MTEYFLCIAAGQDKEAAKHLAAAGRDTAMAVTIRRRLALLLRVEQHLAELESKCRTAHNAEVIAQQRTDGAAKYLELRAELIGNPRQLNRDEESAFRMAAATGGYRDDLDKLLPAIKLSMEHRAADLTRPFDFEEPVQLGR